MKRTRQKVQKPSDEDKNIILPSDDLILKFFYTEKKQVMKKENIRIKIIRLMKKSIRYRIKFFGIKNPSEKRKKIQEKKNLTRKKVYT